MENALALFTVIYAIIIGFALLVSLAIWICQAIGLQSIAKRRGIEKHAAVWDIFGVGQAYITGAISDDYARRTNAKETKHRKVLLGLGIPMVVISVLVLILSCGLLFQTFTGIKNEFPQYLDSQDGSISYSIDISGDSDDMFTFEDSSVYISGSMDGSIAPFEDIPEFAANILISSVFIVLIAAILMPLSIAYSVFYYIALYKLFKSCDSKNALLYLLLGIFIPLSLPIVLLIIRTKDDASLTLE